jgi:chemotaxis protein MotB
MKWTNSLIVFCCIAFVSCVPHRKLIDAESKISALEAKLKGLEQSMEALRAQKESEINKNINLSRRIEDLRKDSIATHKALNMQISAYDKLTDVQQKTIANSEAENAKMLRELNKRSEELRKKELALADKESQVIAAQKKANNLTAGLKAREKKIKELERALAAKDSAVKNLNKSITDALTNYKGLGLSVTQKDGKVYVSLEEKLLFKSGSYAIGDKGKKVLLSVAEALNSNPDVTIMIEGHTDDVPYKGSGVIKDNWDLSVLRATTIVKILVEEGKVDPKRILAAGRAEHMPIAEGKTKEARQANRRTEIILTPKIQELLKSLE